jgi:hypothetical protein
VQRCATLVRSSMLRVVSEAEISVQAPQVALNDGFTVTIFLQSKGSPWLPSFSAAEFIGRRSPPDGKGLPLCRIRSGRVRAIDEHLPWRREIPPVDRACVVAIARRKQARAGPAGEARGAADSGSAAHLHPGRSVGDQLQPPWTGPRDTPVHRRDPGFRRSSSPAKHRANPLPRIGDGLDIHAEPRTMADDLRAVLETLDPKARDDVRHALIRDQADRDAICKLYGWPQTFVGTDR